MMGTECVGLEREGQAGSGLGARLPELAGRLRGYQSAEGRILEDSL